MALANDWIWTIFFQMLYSYNQNEHLIVSGFAYKLGYMEKIQIHWLLNVNVNAYFHLFWWLLFLSLSNTH